jgi:hypothetical protein
MNDVAVRVATAAALLWLGMVLAISFLEAPLKFRAPGLDARVGLAIGRIVFRALNLAEIGWAVVIAVTLIIDRQSVPVTVAATVTIALLVIQVGLVRPRLNRRSDRVLAGEDVPRSSSHHVYIALEAVKVIALIVLGAWLLSD